MTSPTEAILDKITKLHKACLDSVDALVSFVDAAYGLLDDEAQDLVDELFDGLLGRIDAVSPGEAEEGESEPVSE